MAKRKRASLKDKSPETLGLTPKKGKGMDLLFGGPLDKETSTSSQPASKPENDEDNLTGLVVDIEPAPDSVDSSTDYGSRAVDELGLPVAMEAPPDDLILASSAVEPAAGEGETDAVDPATSPFAMPVPEAPDIVTPTDIANDLTGILENESLPNAEEDNLANSEKETDLSDIVEESTPPDSSAEGEDLAGIVTEDNLSGLVAAEAPSPPAEDELPPVDLSGLAPAPVPEAEDATDLSGIMGADEGMSGLSVDMADVSTAPPPTTAAPINVAPAAYTPTPVPVAGDPTPYVPPSPPPSIPPPSTATGAPSLSPPRPAPIELEPMSGGVVNALGAFGEAIPSSREDFLPKDDLPDYKLTVRPQEQVERDDAITQQVLDYVGDRRDELFTEIQKLHEDVAEKLSSNKEDLNFALDTLLEANDLIIENPRQYDEALYRVALVKAMLVRRHRLTFWSYRMGIAIFVYGILFVALCIWGIFFPINFNALLRGDELGPVYEAIWLTALAGGLGGAVEILWRLYWRVSVKQDFDPQYLMYYIVKPVLGFVLGLVMYFVVAVATSITGASGGTQALPQAGASAGFVLTMLLGFFAGYRQESVFDMIYVLIKKIAPEAGEAGVKSVKPIDDIESPTPPVS